MCQYKKIMDTQEGGCCSIFGLGLLSAYTQKSHGLPNCMFIGNKPARIKILTAVVKTVSQLSMMDIYTFLWFLYPKQMNKYLQQSRLEFTPD